MNKLNNINNWDSIVFMTNTYCYLDLWVIKILHFNYEKFYQFIPLITNQNAS